MRQRQSSSVPADDEETGGTPVPKSRRVGKKKRRTHKSNLSLWLIVVMCIPIAALLLAVATFRKTTSSTISPLPPLRQSLFIPDIGVATKCQNELLLSRNQLDKSLGTTVHTTCKYALFHFARVTAHSSHSWDSFSIVALGTTFLLHHQRQQGNFDYEYDWIKDENVNDDMEVRQAGALWGMALLFHDQMDSDSRASGSSTSAAEVLQHTARSVQRGLDFFARHSKVLQPQDAEHTMRYLTYPGDKWHGTGTQALVCLALIDFLRAFQSPRDAALVGVTPSQMDSYFTLLDELLPFLVTQHSNALNHVYSGRFEAYDALVQSGKDVLESGMWFGSDDTNMVPWWLKQQERWTTGYFYDKYNDFGNRKGGGSPYYNGESLLAIAKAAKYLGNRYVHLWPVAAGTAIALHKVHVEEALEEEEDSDETKGVYQWLSMSLFELATVTLGEGHVERFDLPAAIEMTYPRDKFGSWLIDLAVWMVDVHRTLGRKRNTGYAYEGIVPAWAWASHVISRDDNADLINTARRLECTIEKGMTKLMSWQVGMGAEEGAEEWDGVKGLGGVQNAEDKSGLRIDVTQHQMHATILTRRLVYPPRGGKTWPWNDVVLPQYDE